MRWLAIHLPELPVELFERALPGQSPLAVSETIGGERILRCNRIAAACGVRPGLGVGAARALCAGLRVLAHRPAAEREALGGLAGWAMRFTPEVSLSPPRSLLLDVAASLRLFGGAEALIGLVADGVAALGYQGRYALAPTPLGALVLAIQEPEQVPVRVIADRDALRSVLGALPLTALGLSARELDDLTRMGLRRVADLLRLPRSGLRERLEAGRLDRLERLLGETPDPRARFQPAARYRGRIELPAALEQTDALLFPCRRLLAELGGFLLGRQGGVQRLDWRLRHEGVDDTRFSVGAARPLHDPGQWLALLRERLERLELPAPVHEVGLAAHGVRPLAPESLDLFPELARPGCAPDQALLDRLRARLGSDAVRGLALVADHRPERAWRWCRPGETGSGIPRADRPLWLLPDPMPLEVRDGRPWLDDALDLGLERERIDIGWWDDFEVARDYFCASTAGGERVWVYRELRGRRDWFLHGLFG